MKFCNKVLSRFFSIVRLVCIQNKVLCLISIYSNIIVNILEKLNNHSNCSNIYFAHAFFHLKIRFISFIKYKIYIKHIFLAYKEVAVHTNYSSMYALRYAFI